ncbi:MAG: ABC transporter permease [Clostridia bacterium]|nr:ABC transporter permease [Clostridia bacterium]
MSDKPHALHEPLIRVVRRSECSAKLKVAVRLAAIVLALVVDALFIYFVTGLNPLAVYTTMFRGTFSTAMRFSWAMRDLASLLLIGVALAPAFKMRFWNTGAEGQVLMGALATAAVMIYGGSALPAPLLYAAMLAAALFAGALWGFIPAWFKARFSTNETLFTLMMNYVAIQLVACCVNIWRGQASGLGKLNSRTKAGWFPKVFDMRFGINLIVVVLLVVLVYCYLRYSKQGYEISVVGESENTARYAGINVGRVIIRTMILSGALCGLTGFLIVGGRDQTISTGTAGGNGFTAIIVAWLAKFNTFTMALISFLLIFLEKGAAEIASAYNLNDFASDIIAGIILFFILGSEFFVNYRPIFRKSHKEVR